MRSEIQVGTWRIGASAAAMLSVLAIAASASAQDSEGSGGWVRSPETERAEQTAAPQVDRDANTAQRPKRDMESAIYETWKDVLPKTKNEIAPDEEEASHTLPEPEEPGEVTYVPPIGKDPENATAVMNAANPMVDAQCRGEVEDLHVKSYARLHEVNEDVALDEIRAHYEELRTRMSMAEQVTPGMVLHHIAECDEFCLPRQVFLTSCHVFAVSQAERRDIVFFDYNESFVRPEFWEPIRNVAEEVLAEPEHRLLLIGRASKPGRDDYNVALSHRRTAGVIDMLKEHGVPEDRITYLTIGEYTPNLDRTLLAKYEMTNAADALRALDSEDEFRKLNQSVLMVIYEADEGDAGGHGHDHAGRDDHEHGQVEAEAEAPPAAGASAAGRTY